MLKHSTKQKSDFQVLAFTIIYLKVQRAACSPLSSLPLMYLISLIVSGLYFRTQEKGQALPHDTAIPGREAAMLALSSYPYNFQMQVSLC